MERRSVLALTGTALATALAGCSAGGSGDPTDAPTDTPTPAPTDTPTEDPDGTTEPTPVLRNGSFESDWAAWSVGRHLPADPNSSGDRDVASSVGVTTRTATDGTTALSMAIDGSQDDGTVWVQQPVDFSGHDYLAVDYLVSDSFNHLRNAAVYAGPVPDDSLVEADFDTSRSLEGHDAVGWKTLTYAVDRDDPGLLAVGFSVVWETTLTALLDDVRLTSSPPETVTPTPEATPTPTPSPTTTSGGTSGGEQI